MQLIVKADLDEPLTLPVNYNHILQAVIYHGIGIMPEYSDFLHGYGFARGQRAYKMFQFSQLSGEYRVKDKQITFLSRVSFEVRSPEPFFIQLLYESILANGITFGSHVYTDVHPELFDYTVESDRLCICMKSPVTVYETNPGTGFAQYFRPDEQQFYAAVYDNFYRKYQAYYGVEPKSSIEMEPFDEGEFKKMVTSYKGTYITAWYGTFLLTGRRKYLDFLYQAGLGGKNSQGFGMFQIM